MKKISLFLLMLATVCINAFAQTTPPVKGASVEGITEYQLANGMKVLLFPDQSKATITVNITYLVGSRMEGYGETGMAHLLEHMMFKGSTKHTNIPQELSSHGARPNGTTWLDRTNYFETFSATDDNLKWALDLESDRMVNSFIAKKDLESEFSVVRNEFESGENNPGSILMERVMSSAYLWHNYGKSTIGSKEDIEKVPIENLQAFYHKFYQPDNAVLTVAGKIDEAKTLNLINEYFGKIPRPARKLQEPYTVEPVQDGERSVTLRRVGDVQAASCGYHICNGSNADYPAIEVLCDILSNEPSGRLYKALVETKKASSIYAYSMQLKDPGFMYINVDVLKEKSLYDAQKTMLSLLDDLKNHPVTDEEVNRGKNNLLKDFDLMFNNSDRIGMQLSEYICQGDWRLLFLYRDGLSKVTAADVNRVIATYLKPSNRTLGLFIPDAAPDRSIIPANSNVDDLVKNYKGKQALAQAEAFDPSTTNVESRTKRGAFVGGGKYALLQKSTRGSAVKASIVLRIGNPEALSGKSRIAGFTAAMLDHGTAKYNRQQLKDELDKLKARVSVSGNGQEVNVSIETVKDNLIPTLELVNEILRKPIFPTEEYEKMVQEELAGIDEQKSEPTALASNVFERMMNNYPKTDFRYTENFDEQTASAKATQLGDLKKFYLDFYNSSNATVSVVGEFDETSTVAELKTILDNWTAAIPYVRAEDAMYDAPQQVQKLNCPDKANAMMLCGMNLPLRDDDPDYAALMMGNYILGGGFLNSRLAVRIRQKEGISYGVGSFIQADPWDKSGAFGSYAIYNPDNDAKLIAAYKEELDKMLKDGFTADELKDAKSGFLQGQNVNRSTDTYLRSKLNTNLFLNRTMKWNEDLEGKIANLTVDQVNAAMRKWINPSKISYVEAGDFERKK